MIFYNLENLSEKLIMFCSNTCNRGDPLQELSHFLKNEVKELINGISEKPFLYPDNMLSISVSFTNIKSKAKDSPD